MPPHEQSLTSKHSKYVVPQGSMFGHFWFKATRLEMFLGATSRVEFLSCVMSHTEVKILTEMSVTAVRVLGLGKA